MKIVKNDLDFLQLLSLFSFIQLLLQITHIYLLMMTQNLDKDFDKNQFIFIETSKC